MLNLMMNPSMNLTPSKDLLPIEELSMKRLAPFQVQHIVERLNCVMY